MSGQLGHDDILISASVDEVMSRTALHQLKWCQTSADVISGALLVPMGNLRKAMRPDFPVQGHLHTFAMPCPQYTSGEELQGENKVEEDSFTQILEGNM
jgi:hypothetical protein